MTVMNKYLYTAFVAALFTCNSVFSSNSLEELHQKLAVKEEQQLLASQESSRLEVLHWRDRYRTGAPTSKRLPPDHPCSMAGTKLATIAQEVTQLKEQIKAATTAPIGTEV